MAPAYIILAGPRPGVASAIRAGIMGACKPHVDDLIDAIGHPAVTYARDAVIEEVWRTVLARDAPFLQGSIVP